MAFNKAKSPSGSPIAAAVIEPWAAKRKGRAEISVSGVEISDRRGVGLAHKCLPIEPIPLPLSPSSQAADGGSHSAVTATVDPADTSRPGKTGRQLRRTFRPASCVATGVVLRRFRMPTLLTHNELDPPPPLVRLSTRTDGSFFPIVMTARNAVQQPRSTANSLNQLVHYA